jgi:SAM-dependent methyltransferase
MHELLRRLPEEAVVLDLGCGRGTFDRAGRQFKIVGVDLEPFQRSDFVQADASKLPFITKCFDVVISNHSLEHIENFPSALEEIGRVLKSSGSLYIAVPDATTITDRLYRWLSRGGGHVNQFSSAEELASQVGRATGLRHWATRTLCTSLSFLNRTNCRTRPPRRLLLLGGGAQTSLLLFTYVFRLLDRLFGTRLSVYGWALYFGNVGTEVDYRAWTNVCVLCGAGHPSGWLVQENRVMRRGFISLYRCPNCGTVNIFTEDKHYRHFRGHKPTEEPRKGTPGRGPEAAVKP